GRWTSRPQLREGGWLSGGAAIQFAKNRIGKIRHVFGNDRFRSGDLLPSEGKRLLSDRLQRIDVVKINAVQLIYAGIDIARDGDVYDKKRPVQTGVQHPPKISRTKQRRLG